MGNRIRPAQELRAFDWVDYLLYLAATAGFVWPTFSLLSSGEVPAYLAADREAGLIPNFVGEVEQRSYQYTAFLFGLFVVLVYVRNYVIMHRIDNHKEARHYEFFFVSYNTRFWSRAERWVRALIVLWVLATTIGAFPPVTRMIHYVIREFVAHTAGLPTYQNISIIQGFFTYYGFVILFLFLLFISWDVINLTSISRQIKKGTFRNKQLGPSTAFSATARAEDYDKAIPENLAKASPVYTLVAYIRPRARAFALGDADSEHEQFDRWSNVRCSIENGALIKLYFKGSRKFVERLAGLVMGAVLLISPFLSGDGLIWQAIAIVIAFTIYMAILNILIWRSIVDAVYLLFDFLRFYSKSWDTEPNSPEPAIQSQPQPTEEKAR